jgi:hypothetical protein
VDNFFIDQAARKQEYYFNHNSVRWIFQDHFEHFIQSRKIKSHLCFCREFLTPVLQKVSKHIAESWIFVIWCVIVYFCWRWAKFISCASKLQATVSVQQAVASSANGRVRSDLWYSGSCRSRSRSQRRDRCSCFGGCSRAGLDTTRPTNPSRAQQPSSRVGHFPPLRALKCQHMLSRPPTHSISETGDQVVGSRKGGKK